MMAHHPRPPIPLGDEDAKYFVAVPLAGDLVDLEARANKPDAVLFYLVRFLVDSEGRPFLRTEEEARQVPANIASALVAKVGEAMTARP